MPALSETVIFRVTLSPDLSPDGDPAALMAALSDLAPVLEAMGRQVAEAQRENFETRGGFFGAPWAPLSPFTLREKARLGFPETPLVRTGRLETAVGQSVLLGPDSVTVGISQSEVPYAKYQNLGTRRIPARVLIAVTADMIEALMERLRLYVAERGGLAASDVQVSAEYSHAL